MRKRKSHLFGGRELGNAEDVQKGKLVDSLAVLEHDAVKIALLIGIADISHDNGFGLRVKMNLDFHGVLLV